MRPTLGEGIIVRGATTHRPDDCVPFLMQLLLAAARWLLARLSAALVLVAVAGRVRRWWRRRTKADRARRTAERTVLPSLYDLYPSATAAPRRPVGLRTVPLERIVGTMRHPSPSSN